MWAKTHVYRYRAIPVLASLRDSLEYLKNGQFIAIKFHLEIKNLHQTLIYEEIRLRYFHLV